MKFRALTVSREFGSGGGRIANTIAGWLDWKLLDGEIITAIARQAHVESHVVSHYDERVDSWLRRINEEAVRGVAMASGQPLGENDIFDAHVMTELTRRIIEEAYNGGNCVIVGRGAQCILEHRSDVFHVFVYAPLQERIHRLESRLSKGMNIEHRIRTVDEERSKYLHQRFGKNWCNPHLYDLMICSHADEDATARVIYHAMTGKV
ncbi:MAG TPA: cytidylate kinase-like family protein [Terracidiphilus sp.]|nr:cytidylate kinase-like family protein [Terracidiphilus sp.]